MIDAAERLVLYHDPRVDEPKEDPSTLRDRLEALVRDRDVALEVVDVDTLDDGALEERLEWLRSNVRADREYGVGGRVFTPETFGGLRPALVVHYGDDVDGVDVYPHHDPSGGPGGDGGPALVRIEDLIDDLDSHAETDRHEHAALGGGDDAPADDEASHGPDDTAQAGALAAVPASRRQLLAGVAGAGGLAVGVSVVGAADLPLVGHYLDCGPGPTEIRAIVGDGGTTIEQGETVEIMGAVDYSLGDEPGLTAFQLDGVTGTIPVYLSGEPSIDVDFGACLRIRGTVAAAGDRPVEGPVVDRATILTD